MDDFAAKLVINKQSRLAVAQIALEMGFTSASTQSLDMLADVLRKSDG